MTRSLTKLIDIGSEPIRVSAIDADCLVMAFGGPELQSLLQLLGKKNGFYAFEGALHVFSDLGTEAEPGVVTWNDPDLWRREYEGLPDDAVFFAEDVFGVQFALRGRSILTFDPETGVFEPMANNIEEWASKILGDFGVWTGYQVAHDWQTAHGRIPMGSRLIPVNPFVLGGEFSAANVHALDAVKAMRHRASIATQMKNLPDGTAVKLSVID